MARYELYAKVLTASPSSTTEELLFTVPDGREAHLKTLFVMCTSYSPTELKIYVLADNTVIYPTRGYITPSYIPGAMPVEKTFGAGTKIYVRFTNENASTAYSIWVALFAEIREVTP